MKSNIGNTLAVNKLALLVSIITPIAMILMTVYFNDIGTSIYFLIFFIIISASSILVILNPFWGLIFIIAYKPFADLVELPLINSGGRLVFILFLIGWLLRYILHERTVLFDLVKSNKIIILFIFSMLISSVFAIQPKPSFSKSIEVISYILMSFFIMQDVITNEKKLNILIIAIALSIGVVSLFGINDYLVHGSTNEYGGMRRIGGIYSNPNGLGNKLMFGIPFILFLSFSARRLIVKLLFSLLFVTSFFSLGLAVSRTYLLGFSVFVITLTVLAFKHKLININKFLILLLIVFILALLLSNFLIENIMERASEDVSEDLRYYIFLKGIKLLFINDPILGVGLENFQHTRVDDENLNRILMKSGGLHGHDIVSKVFASIGLLGTTILLIIFYRVLHNMHRAAKNFKLQGNTYWFNFTIILQAGYIALLSSGIGSGMIYNSQLWLYYSIALLMYKWGKLNEVKINTQGIRESVTIKTMESGY